MGVTDYLLTGMILQVHIQNVGHTIMVYFLQLSFQKKTKVLMEEIPNNHLGCIKTL